jgi:hypothetical protein
MNLSSGQSRVLVAVTAALALSVWQFGTTGAQQAIQPPTITPQATPTPQPPPPPRTGLILGQVVDSFGQSLAGALVTLNSPVLAPGPTQLRAFTTAEGKFAFIDLPRGSYTLNASKPGYAPGAFGRQRPAGQPQSFDLSEGERRSSVRVTMWKHGAIVGTVYDDAGEPLVGATIWSLIRNYGKGRPKFLDGPAATTDDRGVYRLPNLAPAEYALCLVAAQSTMPASLVETWAAARQAGTTTDVQRQFSSATIGFGGRLPTAGIRVGDAVLHTFGPFSSGMIPPAPGEDGRIWSYQTTCHPAIVGVSRAEVVSLTPAEERTGVDIRLKLAPGVPITGTVIGPDGPVPNAGVRLAGDFADDMDHELTWESALTISDAAGRFTFLGVPAGRYTLRALKAPLAAAAGESGLPTSLRPPDTPPQSVAEPTLWANLPLSIGAEGLTNITVKMQTGFRVSGRVQFDGKAERPPETVVRNLTFVLEPADGHQIGYASVGRARPNPDGTVSTLQVPPGRYLARPTAPGATRGWSFKSAILNGRDVSVIPLELGSDLSGLTLIYTDAPSGITGSVRDEGGQPDPTAAVIIFPTEQSEWMNYGLAPRRLLYARVSSASQFTFTGVPPGTYFIAAIDDALTTNWRDPRMLLMLSRGAETVTLQDGEKKSVNVVSRKPR